MTTPGDESNFDYTDDSVIAKISVEVPAGSVTSLAEISQQTHSLRTEMEALARAQGDWLNYLQSLPEIAQRAAQAQQNLITQLERTAYIQNELGGNQANVGMTTGAAGGQGQQPGAGGYSTAAPPGYMNPFMGGMGMGMGGMGQYAGMGMPQAQQYMQGMAGSDPRMYANMMAQRGQAVNPAQMGLVGAPVGGGGGGGGQQPPPPPQRASAAPPNAAQGGAPAGSAPQPGPAGAGGAGGGPAPAGWQNAAAQVANEMNSGTAGAVGRLGMGALRAAGGAGRVGSMVAGMGGGAVAAGLGIAGGAALAGYIGNNLVQNTGEQWLKYQQIGNETGEGGWKGVGTELGAKWEAFIDPSLDSKQTREIKQRTLAGGYRGEAGNRVEDAMQRNIKDYGMSFEETMNMVGSSVLSTSSSAGEFNKNMSEMDATLKGLKSTVKEGAASGGVGPSLSQAKANLSTFDAALSPRGVDAGDMGKVAADIAKQLAAIPALATNQEVTKSLANLMTNDSMAVAVAADNGISGMPSALHYKMGENEGIYFWNYLKKIATQVHNANPQAPIEDAAAVLMDYLNAMGGSFNPTQIQQLYPLLLGQKAPEMRSGAEGQKSKTPASAFGGAKASGSTGTPASASAGGGKPATGGGKAAPAPAPAGPSDMSPEATDLYREEGGATTAKPSSSRSGAQGSGGPKTYTAPAAAQVNGTVTGQVAITIDQQGVAHAPATIQLTGAQVAVNNGQSGGGRNEPGPGQYHQETGWGR